MTLRNATAAVVASALAFAGIASAEPLAWQVATERGLATYALAATGGTLKLVCDPDRVYGATSNAGLVVWFPKDPKPALLAVLAETGEQARLVIANGMASEASADPREWNKMLAMLRDGGSFAVVTARDSVTFSAEPLPELDCD